MLGGLRVVWITSLFCALVFIMISTTATAGPLSSVKEGMMVGSCDSHGLDWYAQPWPGPFQHEQSPYQAVHAFIPTKAPVVGDGHFDAYARLCDALAPLPVFSEVYSRVQFTKT